MLLTTLAVIAVMFSCLAVAVDQSWIEVDADEDVVYAQDVVAASDDGGITVRINVGSGGAMPKYANLSDRPWHQFASTAQRVIMPLGLTTLDANAFKDFTQLKTINLTYKIKAIGDGAFDGCTSLESITIPANTLTIGTGVFKGCSSLKSIEVESGNMNHVSLDGVLMKLGPTAKYNGVSGIQTYTLMSYPAKHHGTSYLDSDGVSSGVYVVPFGTTVISDSAFYGAKELWGIIITEAVETIGKSAFEGCSSLATITFPDSVKSIGEKAFYDCTSLKAISFGKFTGAAEDATVIGSNAFTVAAGHTSKLAFVAVAYDTVGVKCSADSFPTVPGMTGLDSAVKFTSGTLYARTGAYHLTAKDYEEGAPHHVPADDERLWLYAPEGREREDGAAILTGSGLIMSTFIITKADTYASFDTRLKGIIDLVFQDGIEGFDPGNQRFMCEEDIRLMPLPSSFWSLSNGSVRNCESIIVQYIPYTVTTNYSKDTINNPFFAANSLRDVILSDASTIGYTEDGNFISTDGHVINPSLKYDSVVALPNGLSKMLYSTIRGQGAGAAVIVPDSYTRLTAAFSPGGTYLNDAGFPSYFRAGGAAYLYVPSSISAIDNMYDAPSQPNIDLQITYTTYPSLYGNLEDGDGDKKPALAPAGYVVTKNTLSHVSYAGGKEVQGVNANYWVMQFESLDGTELTLKAVDVTDGKMYPNMLYKNKNDYGFKDKEGETPVYANVKFAKDITAHYDSASKLVYIEIDHILFVCGYKSLFMDPSDPGYASASDTTVIPDYTKGTAPWSSIISNKNINHIVIAPGITSIGAYAFYSEDNAVKSVFVPEECVSIGQYAFSGLCMEYQYLPANVGSLGEVGSGDAEYPTAFMGCNNLKWIEVSKNNASYSTVSGCLYEKTSGKDYAKLLIVPSKKTGSLTVADGATLIAPYAAKNSSISSIDFNEVVKIETQAFAGSSLLTVETKDVESIATSAFKDSTEISTITFAVKEDPTQTISVGESAFSGCTGLTMIQTYTANTTFGADSIPTMGKTDDKLWWEAGVTKISNIAKNGYEVLQQEDQFFTVGEVPVEYEYFGYNLLWAFIQKTGTLRIVMNDSTIGYGTMPNDWTQGQSKWNDNAGTITNVVLSDGVRNIAPYAFYNVNTKDFVLPTTVTTIGAYAFLNSAIESIKAQGVSEIGEGAFTNSSNTPTLNSFTGSSASSIGASAFEGCEGLTKFDLEAAKSIGSDAFKGTKLTSAVFGPIGSTANSIGSGAFDIAELKTVVFTEAIADGSVNSGAFQAGWYKNGEGEGHDSIAGAIAAQTYFIKEGLVLMGYIYDTQGNKSIEWTVQSGLLVIEGAGYGTTPQFSTLHKVTGDPSGSAEKEGYKLVVNIPEAWVFTDVSGVITPAESTVEVTLTKDNEPVSEFTTTLTVPGDVTEGEDLKISTEKSGTYTINVECDYEGGSITASAQFLAHSETVSADRPSAWDDINISILKDVSSIHDGFYSDLTHMSSAVLNSVTSIGKSAFEGCTSLTSLAIPSGVSRVPDSAFAGCTSLSAVSFGNEDMTSIAYNAFKDGNMDGVSISIKGEYKSTIDPAETPVMNQAVLRDLLTTQAQPTAVAKIVDDITVTSPITPYNGATVDFNGHVLTNRNGNVFARTPTYIVDSNETQRNNFTYDGSWYPTPKDGELPLPPTYAYTLGGALLENGDLKDTGSSYKNVYYLLNLAMVAVSDSTMIYDGTEKKPALSSVSLNGYEIDPTLYSVVYGNNVHAGQDTAYAIVSLNKLPSLRGTGSFSIEPAALTLDFSRSSFATILDSEPQAFRYNGGNSFSAVAKGVLIGNLIGMRTYEDVPITVTASGPNFVEAGYKYGTTAASGVYTISVASTDYVAPETSSTRFIIDKADLKLTVDPLLATKVYDGIDAENKDVHKLVYEVTDVSGLVGSDTVATKPKITSYSGAAGYYSYADSAAAGRFTMTTPIVINNPTSGTATSNYNLVWEGQMYIQPAHIVLYAVDAAKVSGADDPELTAQAVGLVNDETETVLTYSVARATGEDPGKYTIFVYGAEENGNYIVSYQYGTFTISDFIETVNLYEWQATTSGEPATTTYGYVLKGTYTLGNGGMLTLPGSAKTVSLDGTTDYMYKGWIVSDSQQTDIQTDNPVYEAGEIYVSTVSGAAKTTYIYATYGEKFTLKFFDASSTPAEITAMTMDVFGGMTVDLPSFAAPYGSAFIGWGTTAGATSAVGTFGQKWIVDTTGATEGIVKLYPVLSKGYALEVRGFEYDGSAYTEEDPFTAYTVTVPSTIAAASHAIMYIQSNGAYTIVGIEIVAHGGAIGDDPAGTAVRLDTAHWMIYDVGGDADILVKYSEASATDFGHSQFGITGFAPGSNNNAAVVYLKASGEAGLAGGTVELKGTQYTVDSSGHLVYASLSAQVKSGDSATVTAGAQEYSATFELTNDSAFIYWAYAEYTYNGGDSTEVSTGILGPTMNLS